MQTALNPLQFFNEGFRVLTGHSPLGWQRRLFLQHFVHSDIPTSLDIPTGLGKTSVMAIWYLALRTGAPLPRRLVYVVDRRAVVDQATTLADLIKEKSADLANLIKEKSADDTLRVSTLRGQHVDNREWLEDPAAPAIIVGTVDMVGSRLLFSGYGISPRMRPYQAGLLGADTLIMLDESHLVPPFEKLLEAVQDDENLFGPRDDADRAMLPRFRLLSLSATGRARAGARFRLDQHDLEDRIVRKRLAAQKHLVTVDAGGRKLEEALAQQAWAVAGHGSKSARYLIYCNSRDTAEKTRHAIERLAKAAKTRIDIELLVGARRVRERVDAADRLKELGYLAGSERRSDVPAFLIATSAGEVGIDLDADHMVCDLAPWERMVQRLGRVNRRGDGDAKVVVVHDVEPRAKKPETPKAEEIRAAIAWRSRTVIEALPRDARGVDASPGALRDLKINAEATPLLAQQIDAATTPAPLHPALNRALVDAWSMTSLEDHAGRPEIAPWVRGWIDDESPQTAVVWRRHLPVRPQDELLSNEEIERFFDAAAPHFSEKLETETWRVVEWLTARALAGRASGTLSGNDVVAFALTPDNGLRRRYRLRELVKSDGEDKWREAALERQLAGTTIVVDVRLAGLAAGLLSPGIDLPPPAADDGNAWIEVKGRSVTGFCVRTSDEPFAAAGDDWHESFRFDVERSEEGEVTRWLAIDGLNEERRGEASRPQILAEHHSWAERRARALGNALSLPAPFVEVLALAARLHDEGKRALRWQRAFNAPRDGIYAKTKGPLHVAQLDGYRHEFGSLPHVVRDQAFMQLAPDLQDLVLHLIAAHHGRARPVIETSGCEDAPPSALVARARDVALRFARLQKRWGPWGLAWWEALLRAADQQASRENDARGRQDAGQ